VVLASRLGFIMSKPTRTCILVAAIAAACAAGAAERIDVATDRPTAALSGRTRTGIASFYAPMFFGRKMADGTPMDPAGDNAASRTLPLGTKAMVTNLATGQTAMVMIRDRGPYVQGRIVDLSPSTAQQLGITPRMGVAKVEVTPIVVPLPGGGVKFGEDARLATLAEWSRSQ